MKKEKEEPRLCWPELYGKQTSFAEHKLKYPEASLSSFLKILFGFHQPNKGHATKLLQHIIAEYIHGFIYKIQD